MKVRLRLYLSVFVLLALPLGAQTPATWDPLFLGFGAEPEMDYGGRTVMSLHSLISRSIGRIGGVGEKHPGAAPAWEFPVGAALLLVQHEVVGHGGRARELDLSPSYSFNYDFSAATSIGRPPATNEENSLLAAGGVEADQMMAHRVILDLLRPEGADGAKVPLAFMSKLDLSLYIASADDPRIGEDLEKQYREGNDMAYYLVSRQSERRGADPAAVWDGSYEVDFNDPLLRKTYNDMTDVALWNLLDPSLVGAVAGYFREHVLGGSPRVHAPVLHAGGLGLTLGTRGALGPQEVSRFLDLYGATHRGVLTVYVRDLDSSIDRTYGFGAGVHALKLGPNVELGVAADTWDEPESREDVRGDHTRNGWNATAEVDAMLGDRWGLSAKVGSKSDGFFPGLPLEDGPYFALGVRAAL